MTPDTRQILTALIEDLRQDAVRNHVRGNEQDHVRDSQAYSYGQEHAYDDAANRLEAVLRSLPAREPLTVEGYSDGQVRAAQSYVNDQLAVMEKYGDAPQLTPERYEQLVRDVLSGMPKIVRRLRDGRPQPTEE